jgi:hypothetical protein
MFFPTDGSAFDMLARFIDNEYVDPADMWIRGVAASLGIVKEKPFRPDAAKRATLDRAARVAFAMSHALDFGPGGASMARPSRFSTRLGNLATSRK